MIRYRDLQEELKQANRDVKYAQNEMEMASHRVHAAEKSLRDFKVNEAAVKKAARKPLPTAVKSFSPQSRYQLFNEMLKRDGIKDVYRDRAKDNGVSVKVFLRGETKKRARRLCDEVSVTKHNGKDCWSYACMGNGKIHRVERYIFRNVLGEKKPQPCQTGQRLRYKVLHSNYDTKPVMKRRVDAFQKHLDLCKVCQVYRDALVKSKRKAA